MYDRDFKDHSCLDRLVRRNTYINKSIDKCIYI